MMITYSNYWTTSLTAPSGEIIEVICDDGFTGGGFSMCEGADNIWTDVSPCIGTKLEQAIYNQTYHRFSSTHIFIKAIYLYCS